MWNHSSVWGAIDALAARHGLSTSGLAKKAGLDFAPLPWLQSGTEVPADTWILLTEDDHREGKRVAADNLGARTIVFRGPAFPGTKYFEYPYVVFGPMRGRE